MVKFSTSKVDPFLANPDPAIRAILLYGPNGGLIRERADGLVRRVVDDPADPFRVSRLTGGMLKDDPARLADEAAALSLTGGRRIVHLSDVGDAQSAVIGEFLDAPMGDSIVLAESGDLGPRSSLRRIFEEARTGAALPCYGDEGQTLEDVIGEILRTHELRLDGEARDYLVTCLSSDRIQIRSEIEKLSLFVGQPQGTGHKTVSLDDVRVCVGDSAALSLDAVSLAAGSGDPAAIERELGRAFREGVAPVTVLRAVARHVQRLQLVAAKIAAGDSEKAAIDGLRPKPFFKTIPAFRRQLGLWSVDRLSHALALLTEAEIDCKQTGMPAQAVCGRVLLRIAAGARARRG